jgi:small subunit ribosomal protein S18
MSDPFLQFGINPLKEVNNAKLLSAYVTSMGKIKSRNATGLTQRSQRLVGKAIRRARHMGIMPWMSKA